MAGTTGVSTSAMTLAQYALLSNDPLVRAVTFALIDNGAVMDDIPFANKQTLIANGVRWEGNLPSVNWAQINQEGSTTSGTPTPFQEQAYIMRNYIDVDKYLVLDQNEITDPRAAQVGAYLKSVAYDFNDKFINNFHDGTGNANAIVGIRARLDNPTVYGTRSAAKIDAGGTTADMTQAGMTAATFAIFLEFIEQLLWYADSPNGDNVVLYMNEVMKRRFETGLRRFAGQGGFSTYQDQFGRTIVNYKGARVRDVGYKSDQSTRIITTTETAAGVNGASTFTSIYAVNYGPDHMMGWQFNPMNVQDIGLLENGTIYRTLIDWAGGLFMANPRSVARLYDIKLA